MRKDVQEIFKSTPHEKQVMMFSATLSQEMRAVCKKFMQDPMEIYVDDSKLTLHGLQQVRAPCLCPWEKMAWTWIAGVLTVSWLCPALREIVGE